MLITSDRAWNIHARGGTIRRQLAPGDHIRASPRAEEPSTRRGTRLIWWEHPRARGGTNQGHLI